MIIADKIKYIMTEKKYVLTEDTKFNHVVVIILCLETISAHILRIFDRIYLFRLNCELTVQFICSELCVSNM